MRNKRLTPPVLDDPADTFLALAVADHLWDRLCHQPLKLLFYAAWAALVFVSLRYFLIPGDLARLLFVAGIDLFGLVTAGVADLFIQRGFFSFGYRQLWTALRGTPWQPGVPTVPTFGLQDLVLGRPHSPRDDRTWDPDRGEFRTAPEPGAYFCLPASALRLNWVILGPQHTGKTFALCQQIVRWASIVEASLIVWDAKGTGDYAEVEHLFTHRFQLGDPTSIRICLWSGANAARKAERLAAALIPPSGDDPKVLYHARNGRIALVNLAAAWVAAHTIVTPERTIAGRMPDLADLRRLLMSRDSREQLRQRLPADSPAHLDLDEVEQLCKDRNDPLGTLRQALHTLEKGTDDLLVGEDEGGYRLEEMLNSPRTRLHLILPVGDFPEAAEAVGRLCLSQFTEAVLAANVQRERLKIALVDEAHRFVVAGLEGGMAQARSNAAAYILVLHGRSEIRDVNMRNRIFATTGIKSVMCNLEPEDSEYFEKAFGGVERLHINRSQGYSTGWSQGHRAGSSLAPAVRAHGRARTANTSEMEHLRPRANWTAEELRTLPGGHTVIEWRSTTSNPPGPPQRREVVLDPELQHHAFRVQSLGRLSLRDPAPQTTIPPERITALRDTRAALERAADRWRLACQGRTNTEPGRRQVAAAEAWVIYWDTRLAAVAAGDSTALAIAETLRANAEAADAHLTPDSPRQNAGTPGTPALADPEFWPPSSPATEEGEF